MKSFLNSFIVSCMIVAVFLVGLTLRVQLVKAYWQGTVYIRADGSVDPPTAPMSVIGNVTYVFTNDIYGSVIVYRDGIVVDGAGYTLQGNETGIELENRNSITVKNLIIRGFLFGVNMHNSDLNAVTGNTIRDCQCGIHLSYDSDFNIIQGNTLTHNNQGIEVTYTAANNLIFGNSISDNFYGIEYLGSFNRIYGNDIINNQYGFVLLGSDGFGSGAVYHNNFLFNIAQVDFRGGGYNSIWDDGYPSGGNYWSDNTSIDANGDGLDDTPYSLPYGYQDKYPLVTPFHTFYACTWKGVDYYVDVESNSTVSHFCFNPDDAFVVFNATGEGGTIGFCRVTMPKSLLWAMDEWVVQVGGINVNYTIIPHVVDTYLCLTYSHSTKTVTIKGRGAIPEFPSSLVLLLFMIATLLTVIVYKRKHQTL